MPRSIKKKVVKRTATEVEVKGVLLKLKESLMENRTIFITTTSIFVLTVAAVSGFFIYNNNMKVRAEKLEYEAYKVYFGLYQKQPMTNEERYKRALDTFKKAHDTKRSPISLFYIANCYFELGRYEDAINTLKELNQRFPDDEKFVPLSYYKMAMISLKKGDNDEALKSLDVIYNYKTGSYKDLSLIESGRILEKMGRTEEAKKKYEELTKNFPQSPFIEEAKSKVTEKKG
jgi:predicted negative regulator of RcsB-dependent stress response